MGMEEHTSLHSEPAGKGRKKKQKKTLVLTLGSPPEKGRKKKTPGINPGQPAGKGRKKKNKTKQKTLVLTLGSAIYRGRFCHRMQSQNCHVTDRQRN